MENEKIHERLARLRKKRNLTAKAMAKLIETPESTYREWENGRGMKLPPFEKICRVLAISVTELMTGYAPDLADLMVELESIEKQILQLRSRMATRF